MHMPKHVVLLVCGVLTMYYIAGSSMVCQCVCQESAGGDS